MSRDYKCKNCGFIFRLEDSTMWSGRVCTRCGSNAIDRVKETLPNGDGSKQQEGPDVQK